MGYRILAPILPQFVLLFVILVAVHSNGGKSNPEGFPELRPDHFIQQLSQVLSNITARPHSEVLSSLTWNLGSQALAQHVRRKATLKSQPCAPRSIKPALQKIDMAINMAQLVYDPEKGTHVMGIGPLQGFKVVEERWVASRTKPAYLIMRHDHSKEKETLWVAVRGTHSVEDLLTDLDTQPSEFMDGHVHKGIYLAGKFIAKSVQSVASREKNKIWLTGHSLGGGAAAIAATILRNDGWHAKAIVFGAPSCVYSAKWLDLELKKGVVHIILNSDVVPRLNNGTISDLIAPREQPTTVLDFATRFLRSALDTSSDILGNSGHQSDRRDVGQYPPGKNYLLEPVQKWGWRLREAKDDDLNSFSWTSKMFSDHDTLSYVQAVQEAHLRHMPLCDDWEL